MLQVVVGLEAKTIASAFLMSPAAMGKRLGRAKDKLRHGGIPFGIPEREELSSRLDSVLEAIYAAFAEGWNDPGASDVLRRDLTRRSYLSGESRYRTASRRTGSAGAAGVSASCRSSAERAAQCEWRIRSAGRAGFSVVGLGMIGEAELLIRRASALGSIGRYQLEAALQSAQFIAAARVTPTGQTYGNCMTRCLLLLHRRW